MGREACGETRQLLQRVQHGVEEGHSDGHLLPLLVDLARRARAGSAPWRYAHQQIAERIVAFDPWRASLLARRVLRAQPDDHRAWAVLGRAQSALGHRRYAVHAYRRALSLRLDPGGRAAHLSRLLDEALDKPGQVFPVLERFWQGPDDDAELAANLALLLTRNGRSPKALELLEPAVRQGASAGQLALYRRLLESLAARTGRARRRGPLCLLQPARDRRRTRKRLRTRVGR